MQAIVDGIPTASFFIRSFQPRALWIWHKYYHDVHYLGSIYMTEARLPYPVGTMLIEIRDRRLRSDTNWWISSRSMPLCLFLSQFRASNLYRCFPHKHKMAPRLEPLKIQLICDMLSSGEEPSVIASKARCSRQAVYYCIILSAFLYQWSLLPCQKHKSPPLCQDIYNPSVFSVIPRIKIITRKGH